MSQYHRDEIDDMADDYEMAGVEDDIDDEPRGRFIEDSDSDGDEHIHGSPRITDTSSAQARKGKDIQGIPWERLSITRDKYRQSRLEQYRNYENVPSSGEKSEKKRRGFYEFQHNTRSVKSTILHFQHDVYLMSRYSVIHWSAVSGKTSEVLNVSGHVAPCEKHPGNLLEGFTQTQVSTLAVKDKLLVAGGFQGELICKYLDRPGISFCSRTTYEENAITNAVEIYNSPRHVLTVFLLPDLRSGGALHFMAANNDCGVRDFDMEKFQLCKHFRFPWPVNHTSLSPDGKLLVVVGDNTEGLLLDPQSGKTIQELKGHRTFPSRQRGTRGHLFATGNQDKTCRVWDARSPHRALCALRGNLGAIRSLRFSPDGRFLAAAEPADFVHIFDASTSTFRPPPGNRLLRRDLRALLQPLLRPPPPPRCRLAFIAVSDRTYGSLLEFRRRRPAALSYLDSSTDLPPQPFSYLHI
ncbi:unnamed protein product [Spirodela intermedia]|uniref:Uncharacterized protein n=1 Tax=Spirodela intermedia TaxID=51605 RepID=A0A7I8IMR0_SPIIN|nr:unnamed protein product [Spirodela intermedia]CAA6659235.1 unnamed protein product [Spirodela intermedia]CAA6675844.1 unnamed protein product [Spirodela intermedia]